MAEREMMRRLLGGWEAVALVGSKVQNFWALQEVEEQVQAAVEEVARLELEMEY